MRWAVLSLVLVAACRGYRDPGDSDKVRRDIEDRNIASRVRIALGRDKATAPYDSIEVACVKGRVTLAGEVDRPDVRDRAVEIAKSCAGVRDVRSRITVPSGRE